MKLYIWGDNSIIVAAESLEDARDQAWNRLKRFPKLLNLICMNEPEIWDTPCVKLIFRALTPAEVDSINSNEVVAV